MQLSINSREHQGVTVLDLKGRIEAGDECDALRNTLKDLVVGHHPRIVLNMGEVTRVDSTGVGLLVEAVINTAKKGGELKLARLPKLVRGVLMVHKLLQAFEVYDSEEKALASFSQPA
jgi:anti-sigma B factor antagonist